MPQTPQFDQNSDSEKSLLPLTIYAAGGLFTYRELAMNLAMKEAIWQQSAGKNQLILPQSEQPEGFENPDVSTPDPQHRSLACNANRPALGPV